MWGNKHTSRFKLGHTKSSFQGYGLQPFPYSLGSYTSNLRPVSVKISTNLLEGLRVQTIFLYTSKDYILHMVYEC